MNDDTRDEAILWLMEVCLGRVPVPGYPDFVQDALAIPITIRERGEAILARARHERERPEDRG